MISYRNIGNFYEVIFLGDNLVDFNKFHKAIKNIRKGFIPLEHTLAYKISKSDIDNLLSNFPNAIHLTNEYDDIGDTMKLTPYLYQKEAIHYALKKQRALIILPCGAGKTPIGIGFCVEAYKQGLIKGKCLIVVKASLKYQWLKEVEKFSDLKAKIIETPTKAGKKKFVAQFDDCDVFIANYETLKNKDVVEKLLTRNIELVFCDEIHYTNNHDSARAKALYQFNYVKYKVGATATPITNNPGNMFGIFNFIDEDLFKSWKNFRENYLRYTGYNRPPKPKNEEHLKTQIAPYVLVKSKEDIADQLPSTVVNQIYCDMSPAMSDMNSKIMYELEDENKKAEVLEAKYKPHELEHNEDFIKCKAKIMALQTFAQELVDSPQLLLHSDSDMSKQYAINEESTKLDTCLDLIESIIEAEEKVCIFSKYERMQSILEQAIKKRFKGVNVAKVNGAMDPEERFIEAYDKFRDTDSYKVLLGTDAMAEGVNLSKCKYLIEYDLANSYAIQTQRWGRLERADSVHSTVYVYQIIMNDSWDTIQQKIVSKKENYDNKIIKSLG